MYVVNDLVFMYTSRSSVFVYTKSSDVDKQNRMSSFKQNGLDDLFLHNFSVM